jgi:outer membrane protein assembly factor BamB
VTKATLLFLCAGALWSAENWPQFRGESAAGDGGNQAIDIGKVAWKTPIPGLAHSSPIIWNGRIYVTTAVSSKPDVTFKRGVYGDGDASDDTSVQQWKLIAVELKSGKILWDRIAFEGVPKEKRHIKSTYASSTPATDGKVVVAYFGSQGVHAFDMDGKPLWKRDLGRLNVGAYDLPEYEWGTASSPIIYKDLVIVQCDQQKDSFLVALHAATGEVAWKTMRDELPSWGTPAIHRGELITNSSNFVRGYDPLTGKELWKIGGSSKITAPTPIFADGVLIVASGRRPEAPIFAIGPHGKILWQKQQRGPHMPTPLISKGLLYVLGNAGVFDCYDLKSGEEVYRQRLPNPGSGFSASPVVAGGVIYLSSEDGDILPVRAGREFSAATPKQIGEPIMATPAISGRQMVVRSEHHLWLLGER